MKYVGLDKLLNQLVKNKPLSKSKPSEWGLGHLLGLDVHDNYISLAVSDPDKIVAFSLSPLDRKKYNNLDGIANEFQSLTSKYNIKGFVFSIPDYLACDFDIQDTRAKLLIDALCYHGKLQGLMYSYWSNRWASKLVESTLKLENMPVQVAENVIKRSSAASMLQTCLDYGNKCKFKIYE